MRLTVILGAMLIATASVAGTVNLQLNEVGVSGLEQMLDIARKSAPSMREADMAVSIYNALQAAKSSAAQAEAQQNSANLKSMQDLKEENDRLRKELDAAKAATGDGK